MATQPGITPVAVDRIKATLAALRMPCALEIFDTILRQLERGEVTALEAIDALLGEELTLRETRRIRTALVMARLSAPRTLVVPPDNHDENGASIRMRTVGGCVGEGRSP